MIHIFNRKELLSTFDMREQARVRNLLHDSNIDYSVKTVNRTTPNHAGIGTRTRVGTFGTPAVEMYEYTIYVKREDHEAAMRLIR